MCNEKECVSHIKCFKIVNFADFLFSYVWFHVEFRKNYDNLKCILDDARISRDYVLIFSKIPCVHVLWSEWQPVQEAWLEECDPYGRTHFESFPSREMRNACYMQRQQHSHLHQITDVTSSDQPMMTGRGICWAARSFNCGGYVASSIRRERDSKYYVLHRVLPHQRLNESTFPPETT